MIYTGYIDSEREPIKVGDYLASPLEHFIGLVIEYKGCFVLSYSNGTYDELWRLDNTYHMISEKRAFEIEG